MLITERPQFIIKSKRTLETIDFISKRKVRKSIPLRTSLFL